MRFSFVNFFIGIFVLTLRIDASELYLLPKESDRALATLIQSIDHSKKTIKIMIYNFTHKKIAKRLKNAAKRGVKIEIIFDKQTSLRDKKRSMFYYLAKYKNITLYRLAGKYIKRAKRDAIMHQKSAIFDRKRVIFGSANWTYSAFGKNYEFLYVEDSYALAKRFINYFERLKKRATRFK